MRLTLLILVGSVISASAPARAQDSGGGDPAAGEKVFLKCRTCHQIGETAKNAIGPVLNGLMGRKTGSVPGYNYSEANKNSGITWDDATFLEYIESPQVKIKGTKMPFPGLKVEKERKDVLAYIKQFDADGKKK